MAKLEELTPGSLVKGILPDAVAELVSAKWHGSDVIEAVYKDPAGRVARGILIPQAQIPGGASDSTVRTVMENARTLKFTAHSFAKE